MVGKLIMNPGLNSLFQDRDEKAIEKLLSIYTARKGEVESLWGYCMVRRGVVKKKLSFPNKRVSKRSKYVFFFAS